MRVTAEPQGMTARRFRVLRESALLAEIAFPLLGPSTMTPIGGAVYALRRVGAARQTITLTAGARNALEVARATQHPGSRDFDIEAGQRRLTLHAESLIRSGYLLLEGERAVGSLRPGGALGRGLEADLPDDLPQEAAVALIWVVLWLWRGPRALRV